MSDATDTAARAALRRSARQADAPVVISLESVTKRFGDVTAVDGVSLEFRENEFFALLGPSGCGKTTLLRMIAGFETVDEGRVLLDGQDISPLRPNRRPINLMFQSFALFPHMSVRANVSYGLEMEGIKGEELRRRVDAMLETTQLTAFAARKPEQLSGGQQQRVALARALVKQPRVLLLDEPLAALDKKLREHMKLELKRLQHEVGISFVVVTHDQEEALVMADRIALMRDGAVQQCDHPAELYENPSSRFVADFIGVMNFLEGTVAEDGVEVSGLGLIRGRVPGGLARGAPAVLAVRPERVTLAREGMQGGGMPAENALRGRVTDIAYHGQDVGVHIRLGENGPRLVARISAAAEAARELAPGGAVRVGWRAENSRILPDDGAGSAVASDVDNTG